MTTATLDRRPNAGITIIDFVRRPSLDRLPRRRALVSHWERDADGRLCCRWEVAGPAPATLRRAHASD